MTGRCPKCGAALTAAAQVNGTAPWLCTNCHRGWWNAEVNNSAKYRPEYNDFGFDATTHAALAAEQAAAK